MHLNMNNRLNRRNFLKTAGVIGAGIGFGGFHTSSLRAAQQPSTPNADELGWRLGCQAWTFRLFPLFAAIDNMSALGLRYMECGFDRKLTNDRPDVTFGPQASPAVRREVMQKLPIQA